MAKVSAVQKNLKRQETVKKYATRRSALKDVIRNKNTSIEDRFLAVLELSNLPKDGSKVRVRNRCKLTGRPRGFYRKFKMSRISLRELGSLGLLPGVRKASW